MRAMITSMKTFRHKDRNVIRCIVREKNSDRCNEGSFRAPVRSMVESSIHSTKDLTQTRIQQLHSDKKRNCSGSVLFMFCLSSNWPAWLQRSCHRSRSAIPCFGRRLFADDVKEKEYTTKPESSLFAALPFLLITKILSPASRKRRERSINMCSSWELTPQRWKNQRSVSFHFLSSYLLLLIAAHWFEGLPEKGKHPANELTRYLVDLIKVRRLLSLRRPSDLQARGPLTISRFMREVLTNPKYGYYVTKESIGKASTDFVVLMI